MPLDAAIPAPVAAAQPIRRVRRRAVDTPPRPDPRDACGLKWQFSCESWPLLLRILLWALRNSGR